MKNSRQLALLLAQAANIQPETPPLGEKIARVQADQARLAGRSPVTVNRAGESKSRQNTVTLPLLEYAAYLRTRLYWESLTKTQEAQVLELEMMLLD